MSYTLANMLPNLFGREEHDSYIIDNVCIELRMPPKSPG